MKEGNNETSECCFELYCQCGSSIPEMMLAISSMSLEKRSAFPSQATLYRYEKEYQWAERFKRISAAVEREMSKEVSMTYKRIDALAALALYGLNKRLAAAIERGDFSVFTPSLLEALWRIQRTERGLPMAVRERAEKEIRPQVEIIEENLHRSNPELAAVLEKMTPEWLERISKELGIDELAPPALIEKR